MLPTPTNEYVVVETSKGAVRGAWREHSAAFLGIPFAEPPYGDLRFQPPEPRTAWTGVRDALQYAPTPQRKALAEITTIPEPSIPGLDTLTVNVFTPNPAQDGEERPVLVYIHGGGYIAGSPASPWYDGVAFNRDGVVTVTLSYRLGFDGFGWLPDAVANRGILDWLLALEWVRDNIAAFGGDPSRVTLAGQSAGGGAVMTLLTLPRASGLFSAAASISGVPTDIPLDKWLDLRHEAAAPIWVYDFAWRSQVSGVAEHCLDVPYIFDLLEDPDVARVAGPDPPQALADLVHGSYVWFATDHDPGWAPYARSSSVMIFDEKPHVVEGGYESARALS
jgi:para-nitrobenzyl esterase